MSRPEELVRGVFERWAQGDFGASLELLDEHAMIVLNTGFPEAGVYVGEEEIGGYMRGLLDPWEKFTMAAEEITAAGDTFLVAVLQRGAGSGSGIETELRYFQVWTFRAEKVIRIESFRDRADALAAAGLGE